ncbi:MAG TPA: TolC family protein [Bryobacteraceae bacterium]|jgi:cobalt-zinc-cadmium efflux system outer membrane protein|nr:TolC family protein [Bryobacteraceae bacterium]
MRRLPVCSLCAAALVAALSLPCAHAQAPTALTWDQVRSRFETANPTLRAGQINIDESRAAEITAFLRPNPGMTLAFDQLAPFTADPYRPLTYAFPLISFSYLHEREHKRELRLNSAQEATSISVSQQADLIRTMVFSLRSAFVSTLQAKAILALAKANLDYFDKELAIGRDRLAAGDIAQLDMKRLDLQRVQYESDFQTAMVNLRTAKITLLQLLFDRTPVDRFDVTGPFDFSDTVMPLDDVRNLAMDTRPDLKAAAETVDKAKVDHRLAVSNGSTDPTFSIDAAHNPPISAYVGIGVQIPLRIFDRNQGEKLRTQLDIEHAERLKDATRSQVFSDVDSAYVTVVSSVDLLKPYRDKYLQEAKDVRDTMEYSYQHGQAALVDYLDAQRDYRATYVDYLNLVGSYLTAAAQLNLAVGREIIR